MVGWTRLVRRTSQASDGGQPQQQQQQEEEGADACPPPPPQQQRQQQGKQLVGEAAGAGAERDTDCVQDVRAAPAVVPGGAAGGDEAAALAAAAATAASAAVMHGLLPCAADASSDACQQQQPVRASGGAAAWQPRRLPAWPAAEPRRVALPTPTSASLEFWEANRHDRVLFNCGLVARGGDGEPAAPVPINALDLAANSEWFRLLVKHLPVLSGTDLGAVEVPCAAGRGVLEEGIVRAIYGGSLLLHGGNVEDVYRAADAMQVPAIIDACEGYLYDAATSASADAAATLAAFDLAVDLHRTPLALRLATFFAAAAQRDAAGAAPYLRHMLAAPCFGRLGSQQLAVLRAGHQAAWAGQGPEVLLVHVLLEVYDVVPPEQYDEVLDGVHWGVLQQEEVAVLVHWALQLPRDHPFTHGLQARVLARVAEQLSGRHDRRYLAWRLEVGQLPSHQRVASSSSLRLRQRRFYLVAEHIRDQDWGLFLCPAPDVSLSSRVQKHTLFVLGCQSLERRVAYRDCAVPADTRIGVGFGDKTALSEWMAGGYEQKLSDGSRHMVLGTIITGVAGQDTADKGLS